MKANEVAEKKVRAEWEVKQKKQEVLQRQREEALGEKRFKEKREADGMLQEFAAAGITISKGTIDGTASDNEALIKSSKKSKALRKAVVKDMDVMRKADAREVKWKGKKAKTAQKLGDPLDDKGEYRIMAPYLREQ
ncbi:hypothetical protein DXG03_001050 [Asterophora parasitica]|uniref:Uncharacterized protein n=1 Tax=Asterophora parasitica TaxID=117018 RepID=A0A9P7FZQ1_9AGAR|nr:hypothetical protein DXG03_001050 [Asterophora parasitica]